eukprot:SAG31_NODE_20027_length_585_cov_1.921811_1_plen_77_part_10
MSSSPHRSLPLLLVLVVVAAVAAAAAPLGHSSSGGGGGCDLTGEWVALTRVGGGSTIPASDAETVRVVQSEGGELVV